MDIPALLRNQVFWICARKEGGGKRAITYNWLLILILSVLTFIIACAAASHHNDHDGHDAITFCGVWTSIILLLLCVAGTITLRKHHNQLAVGMFMGIIFVMCSQMLIVFAVFAEHADQHSTVNAKDSENAMAVFSFFLFLAFTSFGGLLVAFQDEVIKYDDGESSGPNDAGDSKNVYSIESDPSDSI
jgi:uncharacterized membrane protein YkvI